MKKTFLALALFLGITASGFTQNVEKTGLITTKIEVSTTESVYLLEDIQGLMFESLPTTAQLAIGQHAKVEVRGWNYHAASGLSKQVHERIKRELEIEQERRTGGF